VIDFDFERFTADLLDQTAGLDINGDAEMTRRRSFRKRIQGTCLLETL
jgi:hypothetical protein